MDIVFLVGLFVRYISIIIRGDVEPPSAHVGGVGRPETPSAGTDL